MKGKYTLLMQGWDGDGKATEVIMATDEDPERLASLRDKLSLDTIFWKMTNRHRCHGSFLIIDGNGVLWDWREEEEEEEE